MKTILSLILLLAVTAQAQVFNLTGRNLTGVTPAESTNASGGLVTNLFVPGAVYLGADTTKPSETSGSGSPESAVTAVVGSVYHRTDGGAGTSLYVKQTGSGNTGWTAINPSGASLTPAAFAAAFAPENLAATTNVDGSHTFMFYRSVTNVALPFQLTNMQSGCTYVIQLFSVGATANTVTITGATGTTLSTANVTAAQSLNYGTPVANACLRILIEVNGNTNRVDFLDNYK